MGVVKLVGTGAGYGASRIAIDKWLVPMAAPYVQNYLGAYTAPALRGLTYYIAGKKIPKVRSIAAMGVQTEVANITASLLSGFVGGQSNTTTPQSGIVIHS